MPKRYNSQQSPLKVPVVSHRTRREKGEPAGLETLFLGKKNEVLKLFGLFPREIAPIGVIENIWDIERLSEGMSPRLVVALDSIGEGISSHLLQQIKARLNSVAMICLVDSVSREQEIELRSIGLVFLGSRKTFFAHAREIIRGISRAPAGSHAEICR